MRSEQGASLALIALGANLGEPVEALRFARRELAQVGEVEAASRLYRTAPVGGPPDQPPYVNAALALRTTLEPRALLSVLLDVERVAGRVRRERWGPRVLDLDLLAVNDVRMATPDLTLPHPRLLERAFVLAPLADVAPLWQHPEVHVTVLGALSAVSRDGIEILDEAWF
ncbi:2-amino-4-hydroxy-6-hydroxymethyldihydropteridine diphosphokinase [Deinococcus yavapaiensis]|uniref:2-amino-4-hydroxy-6-hydroxymethyldihydropteridine diphosphokinase n=1 Tax=Deinococcus yavapaiensis KR-236 TaxID=694435 RepID=A0A318S5W3_9DEIO|nr:2-amino-4-hydroxy-6-hydroxymethyldihydropteridine diphosphokinase [Deinococcus yavapaiensis]PYE51193.1 2-amino-4-hydroxy-6-hydroxymethyldihydropteridine diphosphokinase [Deinococcus yavapaiensis KR-236]